MRAEQFRMMSSALKIAVFMVLIAALSNAAFGNGLITNVNISSKPDCVVINVTGETPLHYSVLKAGSGKYIVFQFPNLIMQKGRVVSVLSGKIYNIKYSNFSAKPQVSRIVVNTKSYVNYSSEWSADKKNLTITVMKQDVGAVKASPKPAPKAVKKVYSNSNSILEAVAKAQESVKETPQVEQNDNDVTEEPTAEETFVTEEPATVQEDVPVSQEPVTVQEETAVTEEPAEAALIAPVQAPAIVPVKKPYTIPAKKVSLNFLGADINDVLKALAQQSSMNIVAGKDVAGNITVSLSNVDIEEALNYISRLSGYSYVKQNDTYLVGSKSTLSLLAGGEDSGSQVEVIILAYLNADDVIKVVDKKFPQVSSSKGSVSGEKPSDKKAADTKDAGAKDAGAEQSSDTKDSGSRETSKFVKDDATPSNIIILTGDPVMIAQVKAFINQMESSMEQAASENVAEIYQMKFISAYDLQYMLRVNIRGVQVEPVSTDYGSYDLRDANLSVDRMFPQALIFKGKRINVEKALEFAAKVDKKTPQIKIEAKIVSITESGSKELGFKWSWSNFSFEESVQLESLPPNDADGKPLEGFKPLVSPTNRLYRSPMTFNATLSAIMKNGNGEMLASPNLMCLEGKPAEFFVGDVVTYIKSQSTDERGKPQITTDEKSAGIALKAIGDVSPDGYITLNIHPEVSTLRLSIDEKTGTALPVVSSKRIDQIVRVKSGETIAVGGLISSSDLHDMQKVPILGDIPLFGKLFRHTSRTKEKTEVVMFITATIVND